VNDVRCPAGKFSPFHGFSRMMSQHANVRDGGTSVDGVSRAGLNKLVGSQYNEGMRKPARNGNPGDVDSPGASKLARHFLKARWRDPDDPEDCMVLQQMFSTMERRDVDHCILVLREFSSWRPGPAGRGGARANVRCASDAGFDEVDTVLRNVRQRIESTQLSSIRTLITDDEEEEEEEDDCDDAMSMRSTVVQMPQAPTPAARLPPVHSVDKVKILQGLIEDIRQQNQIKYHHIQSAPHDARSGHAWTPLPVEPKSSEGTSSADLLHSLFRQVASQQPAPMSLMPVNSSRFMGGVNTWTPPPLLASAPSREEIMNASSSRVQALCAAAAAASDPSSDSLGVAEPATPLALAKMNVGSSGLMLPPLREVLLLAMHRPLSL